MIVSLEEAKMYLRVDGDEEDALITGFIETAEELCEGVLRYPLSEFEEIPDTVKLTVIYLVASMYEKRETLDMKEALETASRLLFSYRKEGW